MKKFSKLFLSCAAVAAVTAAVATSAMAAGEVSATYTPAEEGATTSSLKITTNYTADQKTLLIVPSSVTLDKVSADNVVQIDQNASIVDVVLPAELADGNYTVYMGGDGNVYSTTFKVGNASSVLVGDVNQDTKINLSDATVIVKHSTKASLITDADALVAADVDYNDKINLSDATCIVKYSAKMTEGIGHVGETK